MLPSERLLKIIEKRDEDIMTSRHEWEVAGLQIDALNEMMAEVAKILDELKENK